MLNQRPNIPLMGLVGEVRVGDFRNRCRIALRTVQKRVQAVRIGHIRNCVCHNGAANLAADRLFLSFRDIGPVHQGPIDSPPRIGVARVVGERRADLLCLLQDDGIGAGLVGHGWNLD